MYTRPFRLSGVTVVPFNDIFPARNSTKYLVEDPREPGTRLGNRAPEVVILKKTERGPSCGVACAMSHPYAGQPAAARERERARLRKASWCAQDRAQPRGAPAPATSLPARAEPRCVRPRRVWGTGGQPGLTRLRAAAASRPPAARPSLEPRAPMPPLPPPGPYLAVLTLGLGAPSGLALPPPRRLPGLAGSPCLARPAAALAAD